MNKSRPKLLDNKTERAQDQEPYAKKMGDKTTTDCIKNRIMFPILHNLITCSNASDKTKIRSELLISFLHVNQKSSPLSVTYFMVFILF